MATEVERKAIAERTPEQQALVEKWRADKPMKMGPVEDGACRPETDDHELWFAELAELLGTSSPEFMGMILDQTAAVAPNAKPESGISAALAFLKDIEPEGPLEATLAVQMLGTHRLAMEQLRRAAIPEQPSEVVNMIISRANKLLGTFTRQVEALAALRGKTTQQKVTVKHVHVHEGGQAIVGNVTPAPGGRKRSRSKPHAEALTHAPEPSLRSEGEDTERGAVPVAGNGQWPV
ncbi:MAG: hypothetical protein ACFCUT_06860 [Kiloniellaceae bacterium]